MENTNKVTIDAAYFNNLFTRAVERERLWSDREGLILECEKIAKERDELKAKLEKSKTNNMFDACLGDECATAKRLAAAERCIEDCWCQLTVGASRSIVEGTIRAYREKKEEK